MKNSQRLFVLWLTVPLLVCALWVAYALKRNLPPWNDDDWNWEKWGGC